MWRYHPGINTAIDMAKRGWLGEVFMVRGQINTVVSPAQRLLLAAFKGGQMFELGGHLIDALVRLMGRPQKVTPFLRHDAALADTLADNTAAVFEFSRAMAIIQTATMQPGAGSHRSFEILGSNGTALVRPIEPPELRVDLAKPAGPYQSGPQTIPLPPYRRYVGDFIELAAALRGEKKLSMPLDAELLVQETLLRASAML
jgi:predicted dehydrogenase